MHYYNEIDPACCAWLKILIASNLLPVGDIDERSIKDVKAKDLEGYEQCHFFAGIGVWPYALQQAGWGQRQVWTGSCPCQPFSSPGKHRGAADDRHLWPDWYRLIRKCRPDALFGEQVTTKNGLAWFDTVSLDLEGSGYAVGACGTTSSSFGAPHRRHRLYFAGRLGNADRRGQVEFPKKPGRKTWDASQRNEGLADTIVQRLEGAELHGERNVRKQPRDGSVGCLSGGDKKALTKCGNTKSFWSDCEWLSSKDGKTERPVEPGTFSLVDGAPEGVGLVRGFGNALCAQQAKGFIEAFMECVGGGA